MQLYIIRHGQSVNNVFEKNGARHIPDCPLTTQGHQQAARAGQFLKEKTITRLYCSPMQRTLQTAQPITEALGLTPEVWVDICEHGGVMFKRGEGDYVNLPGMTRSEITFRFPDYRLPESVTDEGWWWYEDNLETREDCHVRGQAVAGQLLEYAKEDPDGALALVTHGTFGDALVKGILGLPASDAFYFHFDNTGITKIIYRDDLHTTLAYHNRLDHLTLELRLKAASH